MKSTLSSVALITALSVGASASVDAETWGLDPSHTEVSITWNHAGFSMQSASFTEFSGTLELDPENVGALSADFSVAVASVRTAFEPFTGHLQSADFFDAGLDYVFTLLRGPNRQIFFFLCWSFTQRF